MIDVSAGLASLAQQRPIFHSEADFKHAFARQLQQQEPVAHVNLEYRPLQFEALHTDLWIEDSGCVVAIELKYPTRQIAVVLNGEQFSLKNHGAQPPHRYDFVKDVERLERVVNARTNTSGYAIMLTNDSAYWTPTHRIATVGQAFYIHEGATLTGMLKWAAHTSPGTMPNREQPLHLQGKYSMKWWDYSVIGEYQQKYRRFRVLVVKIPPGSA